MAKKAEVKPDASLFARTETPTPPAPLTTAQPSKLKRKAKAATVKGSAAATVAPDGFPDIDAGMMIPRGAGYTQGELDALQYIAERWDVARNALMRLAVRDFIKRYRTGEISKDDYFEVYEARPKTKLKL
jgi:hypothetical protein